MPAREEVTQLMPLSSLPAGIAAGTRQLTLHHARQRKRHLIIANYAVGADVC